MNDQQPITEICSACSHAADLCYKLLHTLKHDSRVRLVGEVEHAQLQGERVKMWSHTLTIDCQLCKNHREVITEFGKHLANLARAADERFFVPEELQQVEDAAVHALLESEEIF